MKNNQGFKFFLSILLFGILLLGISPSGFSQCEPDLINCIDTDEPGQMCPAVLPDAMIGEFYEQNITVLTPESGNVGDLNINVHKLKLESIENLPDGIIFHSETDEFYAKEAYCISLSGTPLLAGTYKLKITVSPYITILGVPVKWGEYVDSTSIVLEVGIPSYVNPIENQEFSLVNAYPNPFLESTKIGFYEVSAGEVELRVFNLIGKEVHYEKVEGSVGINYFDFAGSDLSTGYYLYSIIRKEKYLTGRLIKN